MKKDRCFKNLIGKASVFFAITMTAASLTGCTDEFSEYLQHNNLLNEGDTVSFWRDDPSMPVHSGDESVDNAPLNEESTTARSGDNGSGSAGGEGTHVSVAPGHEFDAQPGSFEEAENVPQSSGDVEGAQDTAGVSDSSEEESKESAFDPDKVNQAIDDLITQLEIETGRSGRRRDVEQDAAAAQDATSYFSETFQQAQRDALGLSIVDIDELKKSQTGNYAFEHLTDEGKTIYVELLRIIQKRAEDIVVSTLDEDVLDVVCQFVLADHPELFYMDGYTYTRYTVAGELKKISFTGNYIYSDEEIESRQAAIDARVNACLEQAPRDDDYSKVKYVYDYLITNTEYDASAPDNQNICSVFLYGKSVCQGYAKAGQYLLNKLGVPTTLVTGKVKGVGHAWNLVCVDGEYTYVDTTWGDSSYQKYEGAGMDSQKQPLINYTYLCCTTQDISRTHTISETLPMPECTSMRNNYYVREGEYFTENDMDALGDLFRRRYADGSNNVTIKCSTKAVYDEFIKRLITDQQVFGYIEGSNNTVSYTTFDDQYILIIWLY